MTRNRASSGGLFQCLGQLSRPSARFVGPSELSKLRSEVLRPTAYTSLEGVASRLTQNGVEGWRGGAPNRECG